MITIKLVDARRGLHAKCVELFSNEKIAESIYRYLCDGVEECKYAEPQRKKGKWVNDRGLYRCSSCNQLLSEWWAISKPIEFMKEECPYCPLCGSYNGEENEE